jgi:hypothetical protein|tara:strand:+ start:714 stop:1034 length:321 start_codon:yes stop_codon:yes gene_type:complete
MHKALRIKYRQLNLIELVANYLNTQARSFSATGVTTHAINNDQERGPSLTDNSNTVLIFFTITQQAYLCGINLQESSLILWLGHQPAAAASVFQIIHAGVGDWHVA